MARSLVGDLATRGFRVGPVAELLGPVALGALGRDQVLPADVVTVPLVDEPLAVLTRLWLLGLPVARSVLDRALPTAGTAGAEALGLVEASGPARDDEVRPLLELSPYAADDAEWWLASDLTHTGRPLRSDHVLGVGGASTTLARWTPRDPVATALDIGTGCGIQAFHLATHAGAVTATDTSRRCLRVTRLNATLNAAAEDGPFSGRTLDLRGGSLLAPVGSRRFDLVVSNPPYVITPRTRPGAAYTYRDGGLVGDQIVQTLVEGLGAALTDGGTAPAARQLGAPSRARTGGTGSGPGSTPAACTAGWCSARCRTRPSTPRPGPATAGTCRAPPSTTRCTPRGWPTSRRAGSRRSGSA